MIMYVSLMMRTDKFFDHIKETYHADITSFPMVRVTNADKTEKSESIREEKIPQGQQIGISETTYRALKGQMVRLRNYPQMR